MECCMQEGARTIRLKLVIPPGNHIAGQVIFQAPCASSPVTDEVQGTITALPEPSTYPNGDWFMFEMVNGLALRAGGVFHAQGQIVWK